MNKEIAALKKRIEELEADVSRLKLAQPSHVLHSHYHYTQPMYGQPMWTPCYPQITYGGAGLSGAMNAQG